MTNWHLRFLALAQHVAQWSKDPSTKVGAVIVRPDHTIASVGYNGFPRGVDDSLERLQDRNQRLLHTVHAEINAILMAREPLIDYGIYTWPFPPCAQCAAAIIQSGIALVASPKPTAEQLMRWGPSMGVAFDMFKEVGILQLEL